MNDDQDVLERGLSAWQVPEPPPDLTDRILAHNAETLSELARPQHRTETPPLMLPTDPRSSSNLRPFWTATLVGFAAAAALLLAFTAGRQSAPEAPLSPVTPQVEVKVTAPVAAPAPPPVVEPPPAPADIDTFVVPKPPEPPPASKRRPSKPKKPPVPELKNPFAEDPGVLRIGTASGAPPAKVYVDGELLGMTPITKHEVEPGRHEVVFEWPHAKDFVEIDVDAGEVKIVRASDQ